MCVKRMLYCPGSGQELLSAFGVTMECHDSSVFLVRKLPLSITEALLKSMEWSWDHAWFAILEPLAAVFTFLKCSFLRVLNALSLSVESSYFLNIFSQRSSLKFLICLTLATVLQYFYKRIYLDIKMNSMIS